MEKGLVSVCSPCYNVAPYIARFLDSLLAQTYKQLELILVNDGSTDETGQVIETYLPRLEAQGYRVIYLVQENGGQASAINTALKHVHGEYLAWPDPDDWLTPDSIERRVAFLTEHPGIALVRGNAEIIREADGQSLGTFEVVSGGGREIENFADKLVLTQTWYGALACMIRMSAFLHVNPQREIYATRRGGQNLQLMLPIVSQFPHRQLPEVVGYYSFRQDSHSRAAKTWEERMAYIDMWEDIVLHEIGNIPELHRKWSRRVREKNNGQRFRLSLQEGKAAQARQYLKQLNKGCFSRAFLHALTLLPHPLCRAFLCGHALCARVAGKMKRTLHSC